MKTLQTIFAILLLSTMSLACESDPVNEELGIEEIDNADIFGTEDDDGASVTPPPPVS